MVPERGFSMSIESLLTNPQETVGIEYKEWLDLSSPEHQAVLARALIALANFGGGKVVLGFKSIDQGTLTLCDEEAPGDPRLSYAPERVQQVLQRYASAQFEIACEYVQRPDSSVVHPVIDVPAAVRDVVFPKRSSPDGTKLVKGSLYTRLPGPKSATPESASDWSEFIEGLIGRRGDRHGEFLRALQPTSSSATSPTQDEGSTPRARPRTVQDRMSEVAPPTRTARSRAPEETLGPDERYVLEHPVSDAKVTTLVDSIRSHLDRSMPTFRLFEIVGARTRRDVYDPAFRFGLGIVSFKGPFVEDSSWGEDRDFDFALSIERFLLRQFAELIAARGESAGSLRRQAESIKAFVQESAVEIRSQGGYSDLVVILEPGGYDIQRLFMDERGWWDTTHAFRGTPVHNVMFLDGQIGGLPVLQIREAPVDRALVCVLDLEDYELILMNASEDKSDFLDLTVNPLSAEDAEQRVRESPSIRESMYEGKHHEPGSYSFEEAVLRTQLLADYRLLAAGEVRERHRPQTISAWLESADSPPIRSA